jgi:anti-sigma regulatory factor (Ser/Thr protein kinase)
MSGTISPPGTPAVTRLPPTADAVPVVRKRTVQVLRQWSVDPEAVETAELVVSELVTNAVKVSRPDDEYIAVRLSAINGTIAVEVWSQPDATEELRAIHAGEDSESGRGLSIVEALCSRWDAYRAATGGVVVWARFPGAILPTPSATDATPLPTREARPVPDPERDPVRIHRPGLPGEYSTDPVVVARVAERLRALFPWHERQATDADEGSRAVYEAASHDHGS